MRGFFYFIIFDLMEQETTNKSHETIGIREYIILGILAIAIVFAKDFNQDIINYPHYLIYTTGTAIGLLIIVLRFRKFETTYMAMPKSGERLFYTGFNLFLAALGSWVAASMLLLPFNYYNIHIAQYSKADTIKCNIDSAVIGQKVNNDALPNTIYYHFQGKPNSIKNTRETALVANMHALNITGLYQLQLVVHKALLDSYLLSDWKIESKPQFKDTVKKR
jgi:hypothetical protein